jgi:hypothetical protein
MPSAVRGVASPWFTGAGSDLLVVKVSVKYLYATTSGSRTDLQFVSPIEVNRAALGAVVLCVCSLHLWREHVL